MPDLNTRLLVRKLWDAFHIPTVTLVDADPHGNRSLAFATVTVNSGLSFCAFLLLELCHEDFKGI